MRLSNLLAVAAIAASVTTSSAIAGGFAAVVVEPPPAVIVAPAPARSTWGIILPLIGVGLLIALAAANEEDDS